MDPIKNLQKEYENKLVEDIKQSENSGDVTHATIKTDERVIARVTDGIYRQPGSALRELISNAYDADATRVVIKTDAPRFDRISIEDNGLGMSAETLAYMLVHIGGSAKRHEIGRKLGITSKDILLSPSGRKLIGKIGIGIFSVAQLTHTFQIITKTKGDKFRTVATVVLRQYLDEDVKKNKNQEDEYESGKVSIWREKAKDVEAHGTTIVLTNIRNQTKDTLRSKDIWAAIEQNEKNSEVVDEHQLIIPPKYHVGQVDSSGQVLKKIKGKTYNIPWENGDSPQVAFQKLVNCVWDEAQYSYNNAKLETLFDYYLKMVWEISLSIPITYVNGNLFDMDLSGWSKPFKISNKVKGPAMPLELKKGEKVRNVLNLKEGEKENKFEVFIDELKLYRPIKFTGLPTKDISIKTPFIFIGQCTEEFKMYPTELSGGPLEFEAYLFWNPKICPVEHRGSLIRVNGASGSLFDSSFMNYQVSEQTRLRQITCEIFIHRGFDSALNIDRESYNTVHPHAVYLKKWLHSALRQLASAQKKIASDMLKQSRTSIKNQKLSSIQKIAAETWQAQGNDEGSMPPIIEIEKHDPQQKLISKGDISYNRDTILPAKKAKPTHKEAAIDALNEEKIKAIAQVLISFGVFENLSKPKQEKLLKAIYLIIQTAD